MPTNLIKRQPLSPTPNGAQAVQPAAGATIRLTFGNASLTLVLRSGETANRIAAALPLFGVAEPWGAACVHFEIPLVTGRERTARLNGRLGEVYYWTEQRRVLIPFGPTPISRDGEVRLPSPCTPWADMKGDADVLRAVRPGAKLTLSAG